MTTNTQTLTQAEFARRVGKTRQSIGELVRRGRLTAIEGRIPLALGLHEMQQLRPRGGAAQRGLPVGPGAADDEPMVPAGGYGEHRTRREAAQARLAELEVQRALGDVLDRRDVESALATAVVGFRSAVENLPAQVSAALAGLGGDEVAVQALLAEHLERLLDGLADRFDRLARELLPDA